MSEGQALRVALVEGEMYTPLYERLDAFTARTGRRVEIPVQLQVHELIPYLQDALASGEPFALVCGHSQYTASLAPLLLPLDGLLPPEEVREFAAPGLEMCRREGRLYQLPRAVETRLLYFRTDLFEERRERERFAQASGGRELSVPGSWEELAAVAQYFSREGRMHGFAFPGRDTGLVATFAEILTAVGGAFLDRDGTPLFEGPAGEWTLTLLHDLYRRWEAVPPDTRSMHYEDVAERFRSGRCAMVCDFPGRARLLRDPTFSSVAGWHSVAIYPAGPDGRRAVWTGCPTFAIPATCPDPDAAAELLLDLTGREAQLLEARDGAIPSRIDVFREVRENLREGTIAHLRFTLAEETLRTARLTPPPLPQYPALERRLWPLLQEGITGERSVPEVLEAAAREVEACRETPPGEPA